MPRRTAARTGTLTLSQGRGPPRIVVDLLSRALFLYLERRRARRQQSVLQALQRVAAHHMRRFITCAGSEHA